MSQRIRGTRGTVDHARMPFGYNTKGVLTPRQEEVLRLVVQGYGDTLIAEKLYLHGPKSVYLHESAIYRVLGLAGIPRKICNHRAAAVYWYLYHHPEIVPTVEPDFNKLFKGEE